MKQFSDVFRTYTARYTLYGILFGLCFPLAAAVLDLLIHDQAITFTSFLEAHRQEPLLWIIDSAPIFLGAFASIAGRRQDQLSNLAASLEKLIAERTGELASANADLMREVGDRNNAELSLTVANEMLQEWVDKLENRNHEAELLNAMGEMFQSCLSVKEAYVVVKQYAEKLFGGQTGGLYMFTQAHDLLEEVAHWGASSPGETVFSPKDCWAMRRGRMHVTVDLCSDLRCQHLASYPGECSQTSMCIPMIAQGETMGLLVSHLNPGQAVDNCQQLALSVMDRIAPALASLRLGEILRSQAIRDPLTNLYNRRYMEETLDRELRRAERHQRPLSVLIMDIDHFKPYNDTLGHAAGDMILKEIGRHLLTHIRSEDIACRYGGDEFVVILAETALESAARRAEVLRQQIKNLDLEYMDRRIDSVCVSIGVAGYNPQIVTASDLLKAADKALYRAKEAGRDQVMVGEENSLLSGGC